MAASEYGVPLLDEIYSKIGFGKFHVLIIVIFGFIQCFDAAELILLAFLGPILTCAWRISLLESSFITMSVFVGMIIGALLFGKFSDIYGRKSTIIISVCGILYFSLLCAASPTVIWVIITRALIGMFIGGVSIMISTFITEIMPLDHRGMAQMAVQVFWSLGSYYISLLTIATVPQFGWRSWLVISAFPMILILPIIIWLPESPRYLLHKNRKQEALGIINEIAAMNHMERVINVRNIEYKKPSILDIFHPNYLLTTFISLFICFVTGISYYGFVISSSIINDIPHKCLQDIGTSFDSSVITVSSIDNSCCYAQTWNTMETVFISITGELLSYLIGIVCIKFLKRKLYLQILMLINSLVYILMNLCLSPMNMGIIMMFGRGASITMLGVYYLYISEVFPTTIRSFSIGIGSSFARIGAIMSSFIVNLIMVKVSFAGATMFYLSLNVAAFLLVFLLPYETKNRALLQSVEEEISEYEILKQK